MASETIDAEIAMYTSESNNWQQYAEALKQVAMRMATERDDWRQRAEAAERASKVDADVLQTAQQWISESNGKINVLTEERDAAELERTESRAEVVQLRAERDAALAEAEGLRADLLAHPLEILQQQLAFERKQHLDLVEDYNRQVATISSLQSDLQKANKKAYEAREIEDRLHAAIGQRDRAFQALQADCQSLASD